MLPGAYPKAERSASSATRVSRRSRTAMLSPRKLLAELSICTSSKTANDRQRSRFTTNRSTPRPQTLRPSTLDGQTVWLEYDTKSIAKDEISVDVTYARREDNYHNFRPEETSLETQKFSRWECQAGKFSREIPTQCRTKCWAKFERLTEAIATEPRIQ